MGSQTRYSQWQQWSASMMKQIARSEEEAMEVAAVEAEAISKHSKLFTFGLVSDTADGDTQNQNAVRGGMGRVYQVLANQISKRVPNLVQQCLKRFCREKELPEDSVAVLVVADLTCCPWTKELENAWHEVCPHLPYPKLLFPPAVPLRKGSKSCASVSRLMLFGPLASLKLKNIIEITNTF